MEQSEVAEAPRSVVLDLLRRSHLHQNLAVVLGPVGRALDRVTRPFGLAEYPATSPVRRKTEDLVFWVIVGGLLAWGAVATLTYLRRSIGFGAFGACIGLGAITFARVIVVVVVSALVWVPIGATIGMSPRLARVAQPVVQILASRHARTRACAPRAYRRRGRSVRPPAPSRSGTRGRACAGSARRSRCRMACRDPIRGNYSGRRGGEPDPGGDSLTSIIVRGRFGGEPGV